MLKGGAGAIEKIGVLGIEDISGNDSVFAEGMRDNLTNALARLDQAETESRSMAMRDKGGACPIRAIARRVSLDALAFVRPKAHEQDPVSGEAAKRDRTRDGAIGCPAV